MTEGLRDAAPRPPETDGAPCAGFVARTRLAAWHACGRFAVGDDLTHAASIAFYSLLSLFPCSMLALAVLGGATADPADRAAVLAFVLQYFPRQFEFFTSQLDALRTTGVSLGVAGTVALVWGALGVFGAISSAVDHAWGVPEPRGFWRHKLVSFVMLVIAGLVLLLALLLVSASQIVGARWFARVLMEFPLFGMLGQWTVRSATTVLFIVVVGTIYLFVPNTRVRLGDVWAGAVVTGVLWRVASEVFSWTMRDMSGLTRVNGSIAAVVAFLMWVYVQAVILLYGAEFTVAWMRLGEPPAVRRRTRPAAEAP